MIPYFHAIWGVRRADEKRRLSKSAQATLVRCVKKRAEVFQGAIVRIDVEIIGDVIAIIP